MPKNIIAVDGNSILNRAYFGTPIPHWSEGTPTNAVYGFLKVLRRICETYQPDGVAVAFDLPGPTFRHELFAGYKAGRRPMEDNLAAQLPIIEETLETLGIPIYALKSYEADDILGTISRICSEASINTIILSGDRDMFQLIGEYVSVAYEGKTPGLITTDTLRRTYNLSPSQLLDFKALMGDSSDKIPGVAGIGEKSALCLLHEYGSLDAIYSSLGVIPQKFRKKLEPGRNDAYLSKKLGEISRTVPIEFNPSDTYLAPNHHLTKGDIPIEHLICLHG